MELTTGHFMRARQLIDSHGSTLLTLDAIHLACAITASLLLLTADKDLARAAKHHGHGITLIK
jgi:predicted nucleic acid-binding protein